MTSRIGKPDTPTDIALRKRLEGNETKHFIMVAGAGSGKTTSLIKALSFLKESRGSQMHQSGQKIACITYTEVAVDEISGDVGHDSLFHVSTIHSFLWSIMKPFQSDLHDWVKVRLLEKIQSSQDKINKPKTRVATIEKEQNNINRYTSQLEALKTVKHFTYSTGSDYANGVLGHSDILKLGPSMIIEHQLMQRVVAQRFPVIFVDESQDTIPHFIDALRVLASNSDNAFCLGFFGDPMQKIYMDGVGNIEQGESWQVIRKPENFRCPTQVLNVINKIRAEADGLIQTGGRKVEVDGKLENVQGTARLFILPADEYRSERLQAVRNWLAENNKDSLWLSDEDDGDVRMLVIVHRMAAHRLGFPKLYSALNDKAPDNLKTGLVDGTAWIVRPFLRYVLPLIHAYEADNDFELMKLLRKYCPRLDSERLSTLKAADELNSLKEHIDHLATLLRSDTQTKVGDVIEYIIENQLAEVDDRFLSVNDSYRSVTDVGENSPENAPLRFLLCDVSELWGYQKYIEGQSPFSTQQGIKGAEFERVLVVIDDEESNNNFFSYNKYFGLAPLSNTDRENMAAGKDTVVGRTLRLFYVCCSRAVTDLAVVIFSQDVKRASEILKERGYFETENIHCLDIEQAV